MNNGNVICYLTCHCYYINLKYTLELITIKLLTIKLHYTLHFTTGWCLYVCPPMHTFASREFCISSFHSYWEQLNVQNLSTVYPKSALYVYWQPPIQFIPIATWHSRVRYSMTGILPHRTMIRMLLINLQFFPYWTIVIDWWEQSFLGTHSWAYFVTNALIVLSVVQCPNRKSQCIYISQHLIKNQFIEKEEKL